MRYPGARTLVAAIISVLGSSASAIASGPFGFEMGSSLQQYGPNEALKQPGLYKLSKAPRMHSAFDFYILKHHPDTGVCMVRAVGRDVVTNNFGTQLRAEFDSIRGQIASVYGKSGLNDFLKSGSLWTEARYWMTGLAKKDRVLQAYWDKKSGSTLKDEISEILLTSLASSDEKGYVSLQYRFSNEGKCEDLLKKDSAKAF